MAWPHLYTITFLTLIFLQSSPIAAQNRPIAAQNSGNISVGLSLSATINGSSWLSPSGDFAFGFHKLPSSSNLFLLAIWYAKLPDTIVWYADGNTVPEGSSVKITAEEGLVLSDPQGTNLWDTSSTLSGGSGSGGGISYGFMNDSGNFVLKQSNIDNPVWQSFHHPTDTLLPGQSLGSDEAINSRLSETNFTTGRFQYRLNDGSMLQNARDPTTGYAYPAYSISDGRNAGQTQRFVYNESGYMYILRKDGHMYDMLPSVYIPLEDHYQRLILRFDGILTWYSVPKTSITDGWTMFQEVPENICIGRIATNLGLGICGLNSICVYGDDRSPRCMCPQGYSLLDPNDPYSSCNPNFKLHSCDHGFAESSTNNEYKLVRLQNTDFIYNDYERIDSHNEKDCQNACLQDCFCAAASFQLESGNSGCWKKKAPLYNGRKDSTVIQAFWIKVGNASFSSDPLEPSVPFPAKVNHRVNSLTKVLFGGSISVNILLLSAIGWGIFFIYHKKKLKLFHAGHTKAPGGYSNILYFSYQELNEATNEFKEELGRGSFGIVYKGIISKGGHPVCVAVKKLNWISSDTDNEFKTEVDVIGRTHHRNLVQLVGFCKEEDQRLLVYEYMSNGSLADYLFGDLGRPSWIDRVQIAQGIAKGLLYLHEECSTQIIHCDIKPQNILIDEYQNARISDFGLAKLLVLNQTHTNTAIRGTRGYVAPEWFRNKPVTMKVDVYSFGVLLLEIICCRKSVCMDLMEEETAILTDWAYDCYQSNRLDSLVNDDIEALNDITRLKRFVTVALWCIQEDPSLRPTMRTVTQVLEGVSDVPNSLPGPSSFSVSIQQ
ncbi:hypothetical protein BVRB_4g071770 [Beta vulgaris subsp. vulgaris]|nr:hypothetical protein BVRB_4g071770 [Beta vulgaris subsp. vulgaris]